MKRPPEAAPAAAWVPATGELPVAQPTLPPLAEVVRYLEEAWGNRFLTNAGPLHQRLEEALREFLDVEHLSLFNNGTNALLTAVQSLGLKGEVVTTPFSFVATANSLVWNGVEPVFADIDERTFGLSAEAFAAAVTPRTSGAMPVHCYGMPCDVKGIAEVASDRGLKVVYDAAHAFGVRHRGSSLLRHGDLAVLSFHATKVFSTVEGGAIVSRTLEQKRRIDRLRNFGIVDETTVTEPGLNGKLSEVHAAFGLAQLAHMGDLLRSRAALDARYRQALGGIRGLALPAIPAGTVANHGYFPVLVGPDFPLTRDELHSRLKAKGVLSRRYFFPLLCDLEAHRKPGRAPPAVPVARRVSSQVLCLPMYAHLAEGDQDRVVAAVRDAAGEGA